jgi:phosphoglycolate phosphatase-like HAD superfamily hydrolase
VLVLDFDGVVADAFDECALVAWLGERPGASGTVRPPDAFVERFRHIRPFARTLDHFVMGHVEGAEDIRDQAGFESAFKALDPGRVAGFTAAANAARTLLRERRPDAWVAMHTVFAPVAELIRGTEADVAIVTAKDAASVRAILEPHGLAEHVAAIVDECADKAEAVLALCEERGIPARDAAFIDDNLDNVLHVGSTGARVFWAAWGYSTPDQRERAALSEVARIDLTDLRHTFPEKAQTEETQSEEAQSEATLHH